MAKKMFLLTLAIVLLPRTAFAYCSYYGYRLRMCPLFGTMPWGGMVMGLLWIILFAGLVYFVVRAKGESRPSPRETHREDPLESLKRRYARGEISREEYERMKKDLEG